VASCAAASSPGTIVTGARAKAIFSAAPSPSKINGYILSYSTYERAGLPASAICNPGAAAIEAALNPDTTQYYFFAHDKNKKIYMATTLEEHNANKRALEKVNAQDE
jgi:cell division protein YceG involved in septum cleavage